MAKNLDASKMMSLVIFVIVSILKGCSANTYDLNFERSDVCTRTQVITVLQFDVYNIFAQPPQDAKGRTDKCTVRFVGENGRTLKLFIQEAVFGECEIYVKMYDDKFLNTPRYEFDCKNPGVGKVYNSYNPDVAISLQKSDAASTSYKFYMRLATSDGPDIGESSSPTDGKDPTSMSAGVIAAIVVVVVLLIFVLVAATIYFVIVYRRKQEEKELAKSVAVLLPPPSSTASTWHGGDSGSVHSSKHSTHVSSNPAFNYPAYRTRPSINEKAPKCNSIDTRSYDSENLDAAVSHDTLAKSLHVKNIEGEFDAMKKGLDRQERRKQRDIDYREDLHVQEKRRQEASRSDRQGREEANRGFGRSQRNKNQNNNNRLILNEENIRKSARQQGRTYDSDDQLQRSSRHGSMRSSRPRHKSHSRDDYDDYDSVSDYRYDDSRDRERGRHRSRSNNGRSGQRSSSANSNSRRKRDNYDDRDNYSDYDDRRRHGRHDSRDRQESRSGTQRSRSQSSGRRHR